MSKNKAVRVGLVMCNHNREKYLQEAIDSVINQSFKDWKLIIWDDGSTDNSKLILEQVEDDRIEIVYGIKNNFPQCQKTALDSLDCKYLGIVDSDDRMLPDCLKKTVEYLDSSPSVGMVFTHHFGIDETGARLRFNPRCHITYTSERLLSTHLVFHFRLFRKSCHDAIGGIDERQLMAEDWDFSLRFSEHFKIECLPIVLYEYRRHEDSVSHTRTKEQDSWSNVAVRAAIARRLGAQI